MQKFRNYLILSALLLFSCSVEGMTIKEDDHFIYTMRGWSEIVGERQKDLVNYFNAEMQQRLKTLKTPHQFSEEIQQKFFADPDRFDDIIADIQARAKCCALSQSIGPEDLVPTGFLIGFGVSGSGTYVVGMGGTGLLTLIVVPLQIDRIDKKTGATDTYYEVSWSIGGIGQGDVGMGAGAKIGVHGAIGLVWGDMPEASVLTGPGLGFSANIGYVQGLGVKAAFIFNTTTHHYNLVGMATFETGASTNADISGSLFYFMNFEQMIRYIVDKNHFAQFGKEILSEIQLDLAKPVQR